ncbi:MAG: hypothetical protein GY757_35525, partial [bacterium]|nr:hypothetical protein [bacterium]
GLKYFSPGIVGLVIAALLTVRLAFSYRQLSRAVVMSLLPIIVLAITAVTIQLFIEDPWLVKSYPIMVNLGFLIVFASSLFQPPSTVERIARISEPNLSKEGVAYTRKVTMVWCAFFVLNAMVSGYTVFYTSLEVWTLYNGGIAYGLMGVLFAGEYGVRTIVLRGTH